MMPLALPAFQNNYIWIIAQPTHQRFLCVDPGEAKPVLDFATASGSSLSDVLITHHHSDHIGGLSKLLTAFPNAIVHAPNDVRIPKPYKMASHQHPIVIEPFTFQVIHTPGHTSSHVCYYEPTHAWLFCGDTLFSAGCGRVFDGTLKELHDSLTQLKQLPDQTLIYCAHEYTRQNLRFAAMIEPNNREIHNQMNLLQNTSSKLCSLPSTIALEKQINPFFRTDSTTVQEYCLSHGTDALDSLSVFNLLRNKKNEIL